jgi:hypothetical protein
MKQEYITWKCEGDVLNSHTELKKYLENYNALGYDIIEVLPTLYYNSTDHSENMLTYSCLIKAIIIIKKRK